MVVGHVAPEAFVGGTIALAKYAKQVSSCSLGAVTD